MTARHIQHHRAPQGTAAHLHDKFYVVTAITNPRRFRTRYELYNDFAQQMADAGAQLYTVEVAFGRRQHAITDAHNSRHIQLRSSHEYWSKENALNIAISRLPHDWKYVAWIDADVRFTRPDWLNETVQQLQHYQAVQMFSEAHDLGPNYELLARHESFAKSYSLKRPRMPFGKFNPYHPGQAHSQCPKMHYYHPGYAWAYRREALDAIGGLIDFAVMGAGDNHLANCLVETVDRSVHPDTHPNYRKWLYEVQKQCKQHIHKDVGYVDGTLLHYYHGAKKNRAYWSRWKVLVDNQFDPETDIKRDTAGLWQLQEPRCERRRKLRDDMRNYFVARREDEVCGDCL